MSRAISASRPRSLNWPNHFSAAATRERRDVGDRAVLEATASAVGLSRFASHAGQGFVDLQPFEPGVEHVTGLGFLALFVPVETGEFEAGAEAALAPAVLGVVGEQARIELGETAAAAAACTFG